MTIQFRSLGSNPPAGVVHYKNTGKSGSVRKDFKSQGTGASNKNRPMLGILQKGQVVPVSISIKIKEVPPEVVAVPPECDETDADDGDYVGPLTRDEFSGFIADLDEKLYAFQNLLTQNIVRRAWGKEAGQVEKSLKRDFEEKKKRYLKWQTYFLKTQTLYEGSDTIKDSELFEKTVLALGSIAKSAEQVVAWISGFEYEELVEKFAERYVQKR